MLTSCVYVFQVLVMTVERRRRDTYTLPLLKILEIYYLYFEINLE